MRVISKSKSGNDVGTVLHKLVGEINEAMERVDGVISDLDCDISVGPLEASVSISIFLEGDAPRRKLLLGINQKGFNREDSMKKTEKKVNTFLEDRGGSIAGSYVKTITSLPGRVYTTMVLAVNEEVVEDVKDAKTRRRRIKKGLLLFGNDPSVINVARLAGIFGVSRTMIYKDLEVLGYKRG